MLNDPGALEWLEQITDKRLRTLRLYQAMMNREPYRGVPEWMVITLREMPQPAGPIYNFRLINLDSWPDADSWSPRGISETYKNSHNMRIPALKDWSPETL